MLTKLGIDVVAGDEDVLDVTVLLGDVGGEALEVERARPAGDRVSPGIRDVEVVADLVLAMGRERHEGHAPEVLQGEVQHDELGDVRELDDDDITRPVAEVAEMTGQPHRLLAHLAEGRTDHRRSRIAGWSACWVNAVS